MKVSLIMIAMVATLASGVMAKGQKAGAGEPAKKEVTAEQKAKKYDKALEKIKAKDQALYNELVALKVSDPAAYEARMETLCKGKSEGKDKGKVKGKGTEKAAQPKAEAPKAEAAK